LSSFTKITVLESLKHGNLIEFSNEDCNI